MASHDMNIMFNIIFVILLSNNLLQSVYCEQLVPCYFVFGDSLVDNGNNNPRNTVAKANYSPYGIDYPSGPTGRFTNGRNVADFIAEHLGFSKHIPPFATASGTNATVNGVNYASGGAGILDDTGKQFGDLISLSAQMKNHQSTLQTITNILGSDDAAQKHLGQCIYTIWMGSNDYANEYLLAARDPSSNLYIPEQFAQHLIDQYSRQMRSLYTYGARKVAFLGLFDIGCVPAIRAATSMCSEITNEAAKIFNKKLKSLVDVLNKELIGAKFTYVDVFGFRAAEGFKYPNVPWCIVSAGGMCVLQGVTPMPRTDYAYFDTVHPTEAAAAVIAKRAFTAQTASDVYPMDIQHLAQAQ